MKYNNKNEVKNKENKKEKVKQKRGMPDQEN